MNAQLQPVVDDEFAMDDGAAVFAEAFARGLRVPDPVPIDAWADQHRFLPRDASSEPGRWRTVRTPYLREPMQVLSTQHPCRRVVMIFGTQLGKTETGNNFVGSVIHQTPGPMMVVQPTVDLGKRWVQQRLNPMIEHTPALRELIAPARSRDGGNTASMKQFPGGVMVITGANSAAGLRSMPVRFLFMDEIDAYPQDVDGEGDPIDLAERRTSTFPRRKILLTSTPTIEGESAIWDEWQRSDQREYEVPCPECGEYHVLEDERLTDDGMFACPHCGAFLEEHHKTGMLAAGRWVARNPDSDVPGFHLPSYYAPIGLGYTWAEIAEMRKASRDDPEKIKTYTNTIMARPYRDERGKLDWREIADRRGGYRTREIPEGCLFLTCGIDTQDDRWAIEILGFGRNGRVWVIDAWEIPGQPGLEEEWAKLDEVVEMRFVNRYGVELPILATGIDTGGHHTHMAYQYCRTRKHKRVLAMKGSRYQGRPILPSRPSPQDVNVRGQIYRAGVDLWHVGTDTAKGAIFAKLVADAGLEPDERRFHFASDLPDEFFMQLTAERYDTERSRWVKQRHQRNEFLDCAVYALAAACHPSIRVDKLREHDWKKIEERVQPRIQDMFATAAPETASEAVQADEDAGQPQQQSRPEKPIQQRRRRPSRRRARRGGFVGGFDD